jgi:hypothetical protein
MSSSTIEVYSLDDRGSVAWLLGAADPAQRASSAIVVDAGTLVSTRSTVTGWMRCCPAFRP